MQTYYGYQTQLVDLFEYFIRFRVQAQDIPLQ